ARAEAALVSSPVGTEVVIASPPPFFSLAREMISGGNGLYMTDRRTLAGVPLDGCDFTQARRDSRDIDAFLFWSRTPFVEPREDGTLWLRDARFSDPRAGDRFSVQIPAGACPQVRTAP
ncbi:MAG: metal-dependent hydrolase, partial [Alphaproteobacteria bacterium]|nr:metal-dependent hydrolase [Alphaproteobacteria bacterium]